jgi:hypothetical protein
MVDSNPVFSHHSGDCSMGKLSVHQSHAIRQFSVQYKAAVAHAGAGGGEKDA